MAGWLCFACGPLPPTLTSLLSCPRRPSRTQPLPLPQKAEDFLRRAQTLSRFAGGPFDFMSVCPPYELVDYNELYDLLDESPLLHEVGQACKALRRVRGVAGGGATACNRHGVFLRGPANGPNAGASGTITQAEVLGTSVCLFNPRTQTLAW